MQEAANTDVDKEEISEDVSDSPSDEQVVEESVVDDVNLDEMDVEELKEFARKEREAKRKAIESVRNQAKKHRAKLVEDEPEAEEDVEEEVVEVDDEVDIDAIVERKLEEKLRAINNESDIQQYTKGSTSWLYDQNWGKAFAPETEGSDDIYIDLVSEAKAIMDRMADKGKPVTSQEEYRDVLRKAAALVLDDPTPLIKEEKADHRMDEYMKTRASGLSGASAGQGSSEKKLTRTQIEMAQACGHDPKEVYS